MRRALGQVEAILQVLADTAENSRKKGKDLCAFVFMPERELINRSLLLAGFGTKSLSPSSVSLYQSEHFMKCAVTE